MRTEVIVNGVVHTFAPKCGQCKFFQESAMFGGMCSKQIKYVDDGFGSSSAQMAIIKDSDDSCNKFIRQIDF